MTLLSVNVNKVAVIRNARGGNVPNLLEFIQKAVECGADGITVHPRPDERHITRKDVYDIANFLQNIPVEFNIEGYPSPDFIQLVKSVKPAQCTLVPDPPNAKTSSFGWNVEENQDLLTAVIKELNALGIRVSLFIEPNPAIVEHATQVGASRVELFTGPYAEHYEKSPESAVVPYIFTAEKAQQHNIGLNAGHDLNLNNLGFLIKKIPYILEVSIGQSLISDCLIYGLNKTIQMYKECLAVN